jgi:hypothetical protein
MVGRAALFGRPEAVCTVREGGTERKLELRERLFFAAFTWQPLFATRSWTGPEEILRLENGHRA